MLTPENIAKHELIAYCWDVAAKTADVAAVVLAIYAYFRVFSLSASLPLALLVSVAVYCGGECLIPKIQHASREAEEELDKLRGSYQKLQRLPEGQLHPLEEEFATFPIREQDRVEIVMRRNFLQLRPLIAYCAHLMQAQPERLNIGEARPFSNTFEDKTLRRKIEAAFVLAVIQYPEFTGNREDLATYHPEALFENKTMLLFSNGNVNISWNDLHKMPINRLADLFCQAIDGSELNFVDTAPSVVETLDESRGSNNA